LAARGTRTAAGDAGDRISRPGGNVTGVSLFTVNLGAKRLGLLRELVPHATTISILVNPNASIAEPQKKDVQAAADTLGLKLHVLEATTEGELDNAFATVAKLGTDALVVGNDPFFNSQRSKIAGLAAHYAVPAIYEWREYAEAGGLMSYGTIAAEVYRQAGMYAARILKGAQPSTLPVLQPTKFELVINLKTANALGLAVPPTLLARADEVIE
jgi:putative ABC transport system substrate-binding protein